MQSLVPFLLFAVVASITPGPTNILVLSNSQRHGLAAAWPIVLGACAAVAALILLLGLGLGELLRRHPLLQQGLAWLGVGWLSYLAWSLFRSAGGIDGAEPPRRLGVLGGAALQLVNPKAWMMALAALALFAGEGAGQAGRIGLLALLFFLVSLPCLASWALLLCLIHLCRCRRIERRRCLWSPHPYTTNANSTSYVLPPRRLPSL
ncbi:LysE family translocator, partial [Pseudomonas aeruginosa]|uniref:LysE family translocator n=39 Tax=Pseudomonadota TaxID=1224 RepID=UPI001FF46708